MCCARTLDMSSEVKPSCLCSHSLTVNTHSTMYYRSLRQSSFLRFSFSEPSASAFRPSVLFFPCPYLSDRTDARINPHPRPRWNMEGIKAERASEPNLGGNKNSTPLSPFCLPSLGLPLATLFICFSELSALDSGEPPAHRGGCRRPPRPDSGFSLHKARGEAAKAKRPQDFGEVSMPWSEMGVSVSVGEGAHRGCVVTV